MRSLNSYSYLAICQICGEKRFVFCSRTQVAGDDAVRVYSIQCNHGWELTMAEKAQLRRAIAQSDFVSAARWG